MHVNSLVVPVSSQSDSRFVLIRHLSTGLLNDGTYPGDCPLSSPSRVLFPSPSEPFFSVLEVSGIISGMEGSSTRLFVSVYPISP